VVITLKIARAILLEGALSFLGLHRARRSPAASEPKEPWQDLRPA
jgi:ABC-type dipeptide/oligopeptide/nickel transport system permease subunit